MLACNHGNEGDCNNRIELASTLVPRVASSLSLSPAYCLCRQRVARVASLLTMSPAFIFCDKADGRAKTIIGRNAFTGGLGVTRLIHVLAQVD